MREKRKNDIDPRDALLNVEFDGFGFNKERPVRKRSPHLLMDEADENALLERVEHLRKVVEEEHDQRFRGLEIHIQWLMALVLGEVLAIVGFAVVTLGSG